MITLPQLWMMNVRADLPLSIQHPLPARRQRNNTPDSQQHRPSLVIHVGLNLRLAGAWRSKNRQEKSSRLQRQEVRQRRATLATVMGLLSMRLLEGPSPQRDRLRAMRAREPKSNVVREVPLLNNLRGGFDAVSHRSRACCSPMRCSYWWAWPRLSLLPFQGTVAAIFS